MRCSHAVAYHLRWAKVPQVCGHEALAVQAPLYAGCQLGPDSLYGLYACRGAVWPAPPSIQLPVTWLQELSPELLVIWRMAVPKALHRTADCAAFLVCYTSGAFRLPPTT